MLRSVKALVIIQLFAALSASAAIFPDQVGEFKKGTPKTIGIPDQALYDEFGLDATESAEYIAPGKKFLATAWRLRDPTGALALFESRRPPAAAPAAITKLSCTTSDGIIFAFGNYVFQLTGAVPAPPVLKELYARLPKLDQSGLPALLTYLPQEALIPNSERFILGPVSLDRFAGRIPPSVAAFHLGAEAHLGRYRTAKGPMALVIFAYPTPSMARERAEELQKIPDTLVRRVGSLAAVILNPPDLDAAERLLAKVHYDQNLTWNEKVPNNEAKGMARMLLNVFALAGSLLLLCIIVGIGFGGFRVLLRKFGFKGSEEPMISLHLSDK